MRNFFKTAMLGCIAAAGIVVAADTATKEPQLPAGANAKVLNEFKEIRSVLAKASDNALTAKGFDNFVARLTTADRKRIGDFSDRQFAELDGRVEQIQKNWKMKYGSDFSMSAAMLDGFVKITEGEIANPDIFQKNWPLAASSAANMSTVAPNTAETIKYLDKGRNVAVVYIPASHDLQSLTVSMIEEPGIYDWRIDVPDDLTGQQIYDRLKTTLTDFGDNVAAWPSDARDAYRAVTHRVLLASYGLTALPMDQARPASGMPMQQSGQQGQQQRP